MLLPVERLCFSELEVKKGIHWVMLLPVERLCFSELEVKKGIPWIMLLLRVRKV